MYNVYMNVKEIKTLCNFKNDSVAVALSGGRDSIALLHFLYTNKKELGLKDVFAFHINHNIREEANKDERFCLDVCKKLKCRILLFSEDIPSLAKRMNKGLEETGRIKRQEIYRKLVKDQKCTLVATAHHMSDQAETVLMNLLRGSSIKGICGMETRQDYLVKPFLHVSSKEIDKYVRDNYLKFVVDKTNMDNTYTRNFLRNEIIPALNKRFDVENVLDTFSASAKSDSAFIESFVNYKKVRVLKSGIKISKQDLKVDEAIASRLIIHALKTLCPVDYTYNDVRRVLRLVKGQSGKKETLNNSIIATSEFDNIILTKIEEKKTQVALLKIGTIPFLDSEIIIERATRKQFEERAKGELFADYDKIKGSIIRNRENKDRIKTFGGTKLVSDYLLEKRVPLSKRDKLPLIVKNNKVLFIVGLETSLDAIIDDNTTRIVKISIK